RSLSHSFPTRRSSDLGSPGGDPPVEARSPRGDGRRRNESARSAPQAARQPRRRWDGGRGVRGSDRATAPAYRWWLLAVTSLGALDRKSTRLNSSHVSI